MPSSPTEKTEIRLRPVQYWINWLSQGFATGKWDSLFLGRGFDFQGVVPFFDDPDLIRINWQATITSGEMQVSQFSEERNIHMYLLGNVGPSMAFGSQISKLDRLAVLAAILSFSAFRMKDSFQFIGYTDEVEIGFPQPRDKSYPLLLAKAIMDFDWRGKKRGGLVRAALRIPSHKSLVVIISDHLGSIAGTERALRILAPRHEILPIILWDEREIALPGKGWGLYPLQDLETGELSYVFLTPKNRKRFEENSRLRRRALQELFARYGIHPYFMIGGAAEEEDIDTLMRIFLSQRMRV